MVENLCHLPPLTVLQMCYIQARFARAHPLQLCCRPLSCSERSATRTRLERLWSVVCRESVFIRHHDIATLSLPKDHSDPLFFPLSLPSSRRSLHWSSTNHILRRDLNPFHPRLPTLFTSVFFLLPLTFRQQHPSFFRRATQFRLLHPCAPTQLRRNRSN